MKRAHRKRLKHIVTFRKRALVDWVNSAKTEQTKADRITKIIIMAMNGVIGYI
ncbi:MAG: YdeI/OmpD-associated family protein [Bacteroides stercoris]